jgi:hypothetical protein
MYVLFLHLLLLPLLSSIAASNIAAAPRQKTNFFDKFIKEFF